jgi:hypothetical protein
MKYFFSIVCASLILIANAWTAEKLSTPKASKELVEYVKKNLVEIERDGARGLKMSSISIDKDSVECLGAGSKSLDNLAVGTCLANGNLDYPNSDSVFAITVSQDDEERTSGVQVLTTEE